MTTTVIPITRVAAVMVLVGVAAAIATPRGRLPLALRGIFKTLGKAMPESREATVSTGRRTWAFVLVLIAIAVAVA